LTVATNILKNGPGQKSHGGPPALFCARC